METNAEILADAVRRVSRPAVVLKAPQIDRELLKPVLKGLEAGFDAEYGGFGFDRRAPDRPKFPVPVKLALLQYEANRHGNEQAGKMLYLTLDRMAAGGIHDQVGGGFHRYSTDRYWRVPHFEKMLYDNAQLADVYSEAFRHSGQTIYRDIADIDQIVAARLYHAGDICLFRMCHNRISSQDAIRHVHRRISDDPTTTPRCLIC
jgi:hypothetical protein